MSKVPQKTRKIQRRESQEERRRQDEHRRLARKRRTLWITGIICLIVVVVAAIIITNILSSQNVKANNKASNSNTTTLTSDNPAYPVIDNIACQSMEQLAYHIHAHLSIYINGQPFALPAQIGIAPDASCYYWLHTHDTSGIVHIESPTNTTYPLKTFFKLWEDNFSSLGYPSQLNTTDGWTVYVDGKLYTGDFHNIQLVSHELITMAYNSPNVTPDTTYSWGTL